MRFYSFVNGLYMSPLQHGLQTAHCIAEMSQLKDSVFDEWASNHKTIVILNAINVAGLLELEKTFATMDIPYPVASFREDEASLNGAITSVGVVLPEEIYESARLVRQKKLKYDEYAKMFVSGIVPAKDVEEAELVSRMFSFLNDHASLDQKALVELINNYGLA